MKKRLFALMTCGVLSAAMITGCGKEEEPAAVESEATVEATQEPEVTEAAATEAPEATEEAEEFTIAGKVYDCIMPINYGAMISSFMAMGDSGEGAADTASDPEKAFQMAVFTSPDFPVLNVHTLTYFAEDGSAYTFTDADLNKEEYKSFMSGVESLMSSVAEEQKYELTEEDKASFTGELSDEESSMSFLGSSNQKGTYEIKDDGTVVITGANGSETKLEMTDDNNMKVIVEDNSDSTEADFGAALLSAMGIDMSSLQYTLTDKNGEELIAKVSGGWTLADGSFEPSNNDEVLTPEFEKNADGQLETTIELNAGDTAIVAAPCDELSASTAYDDDYSFGYKKDAEGNETDMMYDVTILGGKYFSVKVGDTAFDDGRFYVEDTNGETSYYINLIVK